MVPMTPVGSSKSGIEAVALEPSRLEIEQSWRRSVLSGVRPDQAVPMVQPDLVEGESRFMRAARDILGRSSQSFEGSDLAVLVADSSCRVVRRWTGSARAADAMDSIGAVVGSDFSEERIGTNGLGTPFEVRKHVVVTGSDHFLHPLRSFSCFGMPVMNPMTNRIEGVVDITSLDGQSNPLFQPFIAHVVASIREELVSHSRVSEQRTFNVFRDSTRNSQRAIAALCGDLVLTNSRAAELLREVDSLALGEIAAGLGFAEHRTLDLDRPGGGSLRIRAHRIDGTLDGTLFDIELAGGGERTARARSAGPASEVVPSTCMKTAVHIVGEPGSGRTTRALQEAGVRPTVLFSGADCLGDRAAWLTRLVHHMRTHVGVLVLDDLDLLPPEVIARVIAGGFGRRELTLVMTSVHDIDSSVESLTSMCGHRIVTTPLRERQSEFGTIVSEMVTERIALSVTAAAVSLLKTHSWPGNFRELTGVLAAASENASGTTITVDDLPVRYRRPPQVDLTSHDAAARAVIVTALERTNGDKKAAARDLNISRTTLYSRMRRYQIY